MSETKTKKKPGNRKIYEVPYILNKYNLTPTEFQELAQQLFIGKHIQHVKPTGISSVGLMMIGKAIKGRKKTVKAAKDKKEADAPLVRELLTCGKPPNQLRLWCKCPHTDSKVVVIVPKKIHLGYKPNQKLLCEKINDGLFRHPPMANV